jgi:RNA polymerase-binding transcription factor DksA
MAKSKKVVAKAAAKKSPAKKATKTVAKKVVAKKTAAKPAAKKTVAKAPAKKTATKKVVKKVVAKKAAVKKTTAKPVAKVATKKLVEKPVAKKAVKTNNSKSVAKPVVVKPVVKAVETPVVKKTTSAPAELRKPVSITPASILRKLEAQQAYKPLPNQFKPAVEDNRERYSEPELKEFEVLIMDKLDLAKRELKYLKDSLSRSNDESTENTNSNLKLLEDGADTLEKENYSQLAARQMKLIQHLENAIARIKNGTYGICIESGKLIPKERLRLVPHTQHSVEAKNNRR